MRALLVAALALAACSIPDKDPITVDGNPGADAPVGPDDTVAPETTITRAPDPFTNDGTAEFEFIADEAGVTFECSIDEADTFTCESPLTRALDDGPHSFRVRAIDAAGNGDD